MSQSILVIGLGNPGIEYEKTRHNVGFHVIDKLASLTDAILTPQKSCKSLVSTVKTVHCILAKPLTFMNFSGEAIRSLLRWYEILPSRCMVITDNVDLPVGTIRVKKQGSGGTHNGIRSIHAHLRSIPEGLDYVRVYLGVGGQRKTLSLASYVLDRWHVSEDVLYQKMFTHASTSILSAINYNNDQTKFSLYECMAQTISKNHEK